MKNIIDNNIIPFRVGCIYNNTIVDFIIIIIHPSILIEVNITIALINLIVNTSAVNSNYIPIYFNCCRKYRIFLHLFCISHYLHINVASNIIMCIYIICIR